MATIDVLLEMKATHKEAWEAGNLVKQHLQEQASIYDCIVNVTGPINPYDHITSIRGKPLIGWTLEINWQFRVLFNVPEENKEAVAAFLRQKYECMDGKKGLVIAYLDE